MEYKLTNCIIGSVRTGGSSGGNESLPVEEVSFNYGKIAWTYTKQERAGGGGEERNVTGGWNLEKNIEV